MLVLVIEDEPDLRELSQVVLEDADMLVVTASDGERALRLLEKITPDVIVTDMMMPVLDGFGFLEGYRRLTDTPAPVVAVSSLAAYLDEAQAMGVAAVLEKPFPPGDLVEVVREVAAKASSASLRRSEPPPELEAARLRAVLELHLDAPAPEKRLHEFVVAVARYFEVPMALVSVVDQTKQFWTAGCGVPVVEWPPAGTPRKQAFCTHAVVAKAALVVQDSLANPLFRDNPVVTEGKFRFYAGVPLVVRHGEAVGTLCLLDFEPHAFSHFDLELLSLFANRVLCAFERREKEREPHIPDSAFRYLQYFDEALGAFGTSAFHDLAVVECARAIERREELACVVMAVPFKRLSEIVEALTAARPRSLVGRLGHARLGWLVPAAAADEAEALARTAAGRHAFVHAITLDRYAGAIPTLLNDAEAALGDAGLA
jgi:CheY-like chemotaxis protein